jgi:hypothetical protein
MSNDAPIQKAARFQVFVPNPATRWNLGKADDIRKVGFPGASLITDAHLFLSVKKQTQLHSEGAVRLQSNAGWEQHTTGNMTLGATGNVTVGLKGKMILAAGSGKGFERVAHYDAENPNWSSYNRVLLHYNVDSLTSQLKKLFYGDAWATLQSTPKADQERWFSRAGAVPAGEPTDGMLRAAATRLHELDVSVVGPDVKPEGRGHLLEGMKWSPNFVGAHGIRGGIRQWNTSEYQVMVRVDPYAATPVFGEGWGEKLNRVQAYLEQFGVYLNRTADGLAGLLPLLDNNEIFSRVRDAVGAVNGLSKVVQANVVNPSKEWGALGTALVDIPAQTAKGYASFAEVPTTDATTAQLVSAAGPFELAAAADLRLEVFTDKNAKSGTVIDFSDLVAPATVTLTLSELHLRVGVMEPRAGASIVLDGHVVRYDASLNVWTLPEGFSFDGKSVSKGGASFSLGAVDGVMVWDMSLHGETATLLVDGQAETLELTSVSGMPAAARAAAFAALVQGKLGAHAAASGASVTLTGQRRASGGSVVLVGSAACTALGLAARAVVSGATVDVETMRARLQAALGAHATVTKVPADGTPQTLVVETTSAGKSAYLKFSGELATAVFGADPSEASGTDALDAQSMATTWLDALTKWSRPLAPLQTALEPVFASLRKVAEVWGQIDKSLKLLQKAITGTTGNPSIGLFAGRGGIALASHGPISQAGHSVLLIAAGKKGAPLWAKRVEGEWLASKVFSANKWVEDKLEVESAKRPSPPEKGNINLVSSGRIGMVAVDDVQMMSVSGDVRAVGGRVELDAVSDIAVRAHTAMLSLEGATVQVGTLEGAASDAEGHAQRATQFVNVGAVERVTLLAEAADGAAAGPSVALDTAARSARVGSMAARGLDDVSLVVDLENRSASLGPTHTQLLVEEDGNAVLCAQDTLLLAAGGQEAIEITAGKISLSGAVDVGGVLTIKGSHGSKFDVAKVVARLDPRAQQLTAKHAATGATIQVLKRSVREAQARADYLRAITWRAKVLGADVFGDDAEGAAAALSALGRTIYVLEGKLFLEQLTERQLRAELIGLGVRVEAAD